MAPTPWAGPALRLGREGRALAGRICGPSRVRIVVRWPGLRQHVPAGSSMPQSAIAPAQLSFKTTFARMALNVIAAHPQDTNNDL